MSSRYRSQLIEWIERGEVPPDKIETALCAAEVLPDGRAWRRFIDLFLLWFGGLALAFAVMFFIAYNWNDIGRFAKFGLVEGIIVLAVLAYCRCPSGSVAGKAALLVATICLGVLLALFGQTYQTGADPWQLLFTWALLMLPWAIIGRFPALWMVWALLMNLSLVLFFRTFQGMFRFLVGPGTETMWLIFLFNTMLLAVWEFLALSRSWLSERWALRLLAVAAGVPLTWLVLIVIFDPRKGTTAAVPAWAAWLASMAYIYRRKIPDLFMLAGCCLSGITVAVSFIAKPIVEDFSAGGSLLLALLIIGMGAGAAFWLKNVHREYPS